MNGGFHLLHTFFAVISVLCFLVCISAFIRSTYFLQHLPFLNLSRIQHVSLAILCCICAFLHGILATPSPASISGKLAWMLLLLLIVFAFPLQKKKSRLWKKIHRTLSVITFVLISVHILHAILT